ncbi:hypothetical protein JCM1840_003058 [Sporobolomyces johnsonii]
MDPEKSARSSLDLSRASQTSPRQEDSTAFSPEELALDKKAVRRLDASILPLCALVYLLSFLDRSNIAKIAGLQKDLKLTSHQYLIAITTTYCPYIVAELPSNLLLKRVGAHIMIPTMVTLWGITSCLTGLCQNFGGLVAARFCLGLLEGGVFPGLVLYLSMFYRRHELQTRISLFFSAASLSGAFSGLLAAAIINLNGKGGQAGWRWIFYLEGLFTALFGIVLFFFLPRTPQHSRFLTPSEKAHIARRLALDAPPGAADSADHFSWSEVKMAATSPQVLLLCVALWGNGLTLYAMSYFQPLSHTKTIVATFGYTTIQTQLLTVPPFICAFIVTLFNGWFSDRYRQRGTCVIAMSLLAMVGYIMFYKSLKTSVRYTALFLAVTGVYATAPALITWLPNNSAGHYRKATAVAFGFVMTNSGGIASTWLFPTQQAPRYETASRTLLAMSILTGVFAALNLVYLRRANRKKAERREQDGGKIDAASWAVEGDRHPHFVYSY